MMWISQNKVRSRSRKRRSRIERVEQRRLLAGDLEFFALDVTNVRPDSIEFEFRVINSGDGVIQFPHNQPVVVEGVFSKDPFLGGSDDVPMPAFLTQPPNNLLSSNQTYHQPHYTFTPYLAGFLFITIDARNRIDENDETNNSIFTPFEAPSLSYLSSTGGFWIEPGGTLDVGIVASTGDNDFGINGYQLNFTSSDPALVLADWDPGPPGQSSGGFFASDNIVQDDGFIVFHTLSEQPPTLFLGTLTIQAPVAVGDYALDLTGGNLPFQTSLTRSSPRNRPFEIGDFSGHEGNGTSAPGEDSQTIRVGIDDQRPRGFLSAVSNVTNTNTYVDVHWVDENGSGIDATSIATENLHVAGTRTGTIRVETVNDLGGGRYRYWFTNPEQWNGNAVSGGQLLVVDGGSSVNQGELPDSFTIRDRWSGADHRFEFHEHVTRLDDTFHPIFFYRGHSPDRLAREIASTINRARIPGVEAIVDGRLISISGTTNELFDDAISNITEDLPYLMGVNARDALSGVPSDTYEIDLTGTRPVADNAGNVISRSLWTRHIDINAHASGRPLRINANHVDPTASPLTNWRGQRSQIDTLHLDFNVPITLEIDQIQLMSLGIVEGQEVKEISLVNAELRHNAEQTEYILDVTSVDLDEGLYELRVKGGTDGSGNRISPFSYEPFSKFVGDFRSFEDMDSDGQVSIADFSPFAYWFGARAQAEEDLFEPHNFAPQYVDINGDGGVSIFDFEAFRVRFGGGVNYRPVARDDDPNTANDGFDLEGNPYTWTSPQPGRGLRYLEVDGFVEADDRNPSPPAFDERQNQIIINIKDLLEDNDRDRPTGSKRLTFAGIATPPPNGHVEAVEEQLIYRPDPNFFGTDAFSYLVSDGDGGRDTAQVSIDVRRAVPLAVDDFLSQPILEYSAGEDSPTLFDIAIELLANDSDWQDGGPGTPQLLDDGTSGILDKDGDIQVGGGDFLYDRNERIVGELKINGPNIEITPHVNQFGTFHFYYRVIDQDGLIADARVELNVTESVPNLDYLVVPNSTVEAVEISDNSTRPRGHILDMPTNGQGQPVQWPVSQLDLLGRDYVTTIGNDLVLDVLANDVDPFGGPLRIAPNLEVIGPATVVVQNNELRISPIDLGVVEVHYDVIGRSGQSAPGVASIMVVPDSVVANDDTRTIKENRQVPISIDVLSQFCTGDHLQNCSGEDVHPLGAAIVVVGNSATNLTPIDSGTLQQHANGIIEFMPARNFDGVVTFDYQVSDGNNVDTGTVTVNVLNEDPIAHVDHLETTINTGIVVDVLRNDIDLQGDALVISAAGTPDGMLGSSTMGGFVINNIDSLFYIPAVGFTGTDTFTYVIKDDDNNQDGSLITPGSSTAVVTILVHP